MLFIGIDPGINGGIAEISGGTAVAIRMPTITIERAGKKRKVYDHEWLSNFFRHKMNMRAIYPCYVVLEEQHPMVRFRDGKKQKQGVTSTFSTGYGFGALRQCLYDNDLKHEVVRAKEWQREFCISGKLGDTKAQALSVCWGLFPDVNLLASERSTKPHSGMIDALLICEYGKRKYHVPRPKGRGMKPLRD